MTNLERALELFKAQLGEFDNIKLLLGGGEDMTSEVVGDEMLRIANDLCAGKLPSAGCIDESALRAAALDLS